MDIVADLVTGPFKEIIEKASEAHHNAGDNQEMRSESLKLARCAERCLKIIEPLCLRHLEESSVNFIDELKDNNEIAGYRSQLNSMLWDFDDYMELDTFDKEKYAELRELCKKAGMNTGEILKRMKLETTRELPIPTIATSPPPAPAPLNVTRPNHGVFVDGGVVETHLHDPPPAFAQRATLVESELEPPPPPPFNPWDIKTSPTTDTDVKDASQFEHVERRAPVMGPPTDEPSSPHDRRQSHGSNRHYDAGGDRVLSEEERYQQMSPQDMPRSPPLPLDRNSLAPRGRTPSTTLSGPIPGDQAVESGRTRLPHRYSQGSVHSHPSRQRSQESIHSSIFDGRRNDGTSIPAMMEPRAPSSASGNDVPRSPSSRGPVIPANFPPDVAEGIERVPLKVDDNEGLIPVDSEFERPSSAAAARQKDLNIGLSSSFYLYKGFCDGAKEVTRGGLGVKKVKKPGFSGAHVVAKCESCFYEVDFRQVEQDVNKADEANYLLNKIAFRLRFLQKSHVATKRADELLFGCVFCTHSQQTLEECDATVFFSQKKLFEHLARHPRPLPQVPGFTVIEDAEIPLNLKNNYDLHFRAPPQPSPLANRQLQLAQLPQASATQTVKRMYGMRLLYDQTPAFELANGARISGVEFPSKYNGEWIMGWHEGNYGSAPADVLKLEPPPKAEIHMDTSSNMSAVARWKFTPKSKDGGDWLKFEQGERITNISWAWQDHWCWSGTNAKGTWGIFPQTHIDTNTLHESTDGSSISSAEKNKKSLIGRFTSRKSSGRPSSVAEVRVSSGPRPSFF